MHQALYRSFRPETFGELLGQEHISKILRTQIATGTTGHAYVFCGTRGTGKTTTARLLAKALNCSSEGERPCGGCETCRAIAAGTFIDVQEIDAASFNGVDDIRMLREEVNYPPAMGRNKVYIIDEAHMLSTPAFNALLKTLEEPPANVVFILATTEPGKLPATILSRCMRLDFKRVSEDIIYGLFKRICDEKKVEAEEDALRLIASNADGSVRDGLSILDRCISGSKTLSREDVLFLLGMSDAQAFIDITDAALAGRTGDALAIFAAALSEGKDVSRFALDWIGHLRNLMIVKFAEKPENIINLSIESIKKLTAQSSSVEMADIDRSVRLLSKALSEARWAPRPGILIELAIIEISRGSASDELQESEKKTGLSKAGSDSGKAVKAEKLSPDDSKAETPLAELKDEKVLSHEDREELSAAAAAEVEEAGESSASGSKRYSTQRLEDIWYNVMQSEEMPAVIRMSQSSLRDIGRGKFVVQLSNEIVENSAKSVQKLIEELMEEETGKRLRMETVVK